MWQEFSVYLSREFFHRYVDVTFKKAYRISFIEIS